MSASPLPNAEDWEQIRSTASMLSALTTGQPEFALHHKHGAAWSVTEIVGHLCDFARLYHETRLLPMLNENNPAFVVADQEAMVRDAQYAAASASDLVIRFDELRTPTLALLETLTPEQWARTGVHATFGQMTVGGLVARMAAHDREHIRQIEATLRATPGANAFDPTPMDTLTE